MDKQKKFVKCLYFNIILVALIMIFLSVFSVNYAQANTLETSGVDKTTMFNNWVVTHNGSKNIISEDSVDVLKITPDSANGYYGSAYYNNGVAPIDINISLRIYFADNADNWASVNFANKKVGGRGSAGVSGIMLLFRKEADNDALVCHLYENDGVIIKVAHIQPKSILHGESYTYVKVSLKQAVNGYSLYLNDTIVAGNRINTFWSKQEFIDNVSKLTYVGVGTHGGANIGIKDFTYAPEMLDSSNWSDSTLVSRTDNGSFTIDSGVNTLKVAQDARYVKVDFNNLDIINTESISVKFKDKDKEEQKSIDFILSQDNSKLAITYNIDGQANKEITRFSSTEIESFAIRNYNSTYRIEINEKKALVLPIDISSFSNDESKTYVEFQNSIKIDIQSIESGVGEFIYALGADPTAYTDYETAIEVDDDENIYIISDTVLKTKVVSNDTTLQFSINSIADGEEFLIGYSRENKNVGYSNENAKGIFIKFTVKNSKVYSSFYLHKKLGNPEELYVNYLVQENLTDKISIQIIHREYGGYALYLNSERVLLNGEDVFGSVQKSDVMYGSSYSYISYSLNNGTKIKLDKISTSFIITNPIVKSPYLGVSNGDATIGVDKTKWSNIGGVIDNNQDGTLRLYSESNITHNTLQTPLKSEYIKLDMYLESFYNMTEVDSYITIAFLKKLGEIGQNSVPSVNGENGILFRLRNKSGKLCFDSFIRQDGKFLQLVVEQEIAKTANGYVTFEFMYLNNEFIMYVNGNKIMDSNGFSQFVSVKQNIFASTDGSTYLATTAWHEQKDSSYPIGEKALCYSIIGIENVLPDKYSIGKNAEYVTQDYRPDSGFSYDITEIDGDFHITVTKKETVDMIPKGNLHLLLIPLLVMASVGILAVCSIFVLKALKGKEKK